MAANNKDALVMTSRRKPSSRLSTMQCLMLALVAFPTILNAIYYTIIASDIYVSETHFAVRTLGGSARKDPAKISAEATISDTVGVMDYLRSLDAMKAVDLKHDLRKTYQDPVADFHARMHSNPTQEEMLDYYRGRIEVTADNVSGIITLKVQAFRPDKAQAIAATLVDLSEQLVNDFSQRIISDNKAVTSTEIELAEKQLEQIHLKLTRYREEQQSIDGEKTSSSVMKIVARMKADLALVEANMRASAAFLQPDNPRMFALRTQAAALRDQIDRESTRIDSDQDRLAAVVGEFERLKADSQLAEKRYGLALESAESARAEAQRQHSYLISISRPWVAEQALYPRRLTNILLTFIVSLTIVSIGALLLTGVRRYFA